MFTARSRQNAFAKRRREQAEAEAAEATAVPFDANKSPEHTETPDIATLATGVVVMPEQAADELSQLGQEIEFPPISAEIQAKIDAIANRAIPPAVEPEPVTAAEFIATISDPGPAPSVEPETAPEDTPKRGRGRPRPQETIDRDNAVHALLVGADPETGISKELIAAELNEKEQQVYSSLRQLTKEGRAETRYVKPHGYRWFAL